MYKCINCCVYITVTVTIVTIVPLSGDIVGGTIFLICKLEIQWGHYGVIGGAFGPHLRLNRASINTKVSIIAVTTYYY